VTGFLLSAYCLLLSVFRAVRSTEVVEASGSVLFRNVKIEPAEKGPQFELAPDVVVIPYE